MKAVVVVKQFMRAMLVVEVVVVKRLVQNNDSKRIMATVPQRSQPGYTNNSL